MRFFIFERSVSAENGVGSIHFRTLMTPYNGKRPVWIEAENLNQAAAKAADFLSAAGITSDGVISGVSHPIYFVAETCGDDAETPNEHAFVVHEFSPVVRTK